MRDDLVGIDPGNARRLVNLLRDAEAALDGSSRRVQALLDQVDHGCSAPAVIRQAARTCGAVAVGLERRTGLLGQPASPRRPWELAGTFPDACDVRPGLLPPPATGSTSSIVVQGPSILITPPAPRGPRVVYTTVGGQACGPVVYTTGRRPGVGEPVQPPDTLPAFPDAVEARRKTPQQGGGLRKRWKGADGRIYEWDSQHGTVETYNKKGTRHLGEYDPGTGKQVKPPDPTRTVEA